MKKIKIASEPIFIFLVVFQLIFSGIGITSSATTYYIKNSGNNYNTGLSNDQAWRTISKINSISFLPGDYILFNRGDSWNESLAVNSSGSSSAKITFGAYGIGANPIITGKMDVPGWSSSTNWSTSGVNIWKISWPMSYVRLRIWLNNTEVRKAYSSTVTEGTPWYHDGSYLYIYSKSNPSMAFNSLITTGRVQFLNIENKRYLAFQNLDIRGFYEGIDMTHCDNIIIEYCNIGGDFAMSGIIVRHSSNGVIRHNILDTYDHLLDSIYNVQNTEDGIDFEDGSDNWDIYDNSFYDWGHAAFYPKTSGSPPEPISNIKLHHNYFTNKDNDYGRAICGDIADSSNSFGNEIYNNLIEDQAIHSQIQMPNVKVYNNIFNRCKGRPYGNDAAANALSLQGYNGSPQYMEIYNNVFANCNGAGIWIHNYDNEGWKDVSYNKIENNIFFNNKGQDKYWGTSGFQLHIENMASIHDNSFKNNLFYYSSVAKLIRYHTNGQARGYHTAMTVAQFNEATGTDGDVMENNISGNPLFINPENDFRLHSGSPGIHSGLNVGLLTDYIGNSYNNVPSIGVYEYVSDPTSIYITEFSRSDFLVFPNPVIDLLHISWKNNQSKEMLLKLFDIRGVKLYEAIESAECSLDMSMYANGLYILVIESKSDNASFKIIK
jgi:hypothetical protein